MTMKKEPYESWEFEIKRLLDSEIPPHVTTRLQQRLDTFSKQWDGDFTSHRNLFSRLIAVFGALVVTALIIRSLYTSPDKGLNPLALTVGAIEAAQAVECRMAYEPVTGTPSYCTVRWASPDYFRLDIGQEGAERETRWINDESITILDNSTTASTYITYPREPLKKIKEFLPSSALLRMIANQSKQESYGVFVKVDGSDDGREVYALTSAAGSIRRTLQIDPKTHLPVEIENLYTHGRERILFAWNDAVDLDQFLPVSTHAESGYTIEAGTLSPFEIRPQDGIGQVSLGMSRDRLFEVCGTPDLTIDDERFYFSKGGIYVQIGEDECVALVGCSDYREEAWWVPSAPEMCSTSNGIGLGATEQEVISSYGNPTSRSKMGRLVLLNYPGITFEFSPLDSSSENGSILRSIRVTSNQ